jgi:hypothetical protein
MTDPSQTSPYIEQMIKRLTEIFAEAEDDREAYRQQHPEPQGQQKSPSAGTEGEER